MTRNEFLLHGLDKGKSRIIEIGPSFSPVAPKRNGWLTTVVDHTDRAGLVKKYNPFAQVDTSNIEEVDCVWAGGPLDAVFQNTSDSFDAIIASHVIEHMVDPISFFGSAARLLGERGRVILAVPDKRLCFDCLRPVSTTGQVIAAGRANRGHHSVAAFFDALAYDARSSDESPSWGRDARFIPTLVRTLGAAGDMTGGYDDRQPIEYKDVHGWVFTPASFECMILELQYLGLIDFRIVKTAEQQATEFLVVLERKNGSSTSKEEMEARRVQLLVRQIEEIREQADWMLGATYASQDGGIVARLTKLERTLALKTAQIADATGIISLISSRYAAMRRNVLKKGTLWVVRNSVFFDANFYLDENPDVKAAGVDPARHYLLHGGFEGRNPGPCFSTKHYLDQNPDVAAAGVNALVHFERYGRNEGRTPGLVPGPKERQIS